LPNFVVYEDISGDGDVTAAPNVAAVGVDGPYDDTALSRIRLRSYPAVAAGSATQTATEVVVVRGVGAGPCSSEPHLNASTQTGCFNWMTEVMLDHIESYVKRSPKPWQTRKLLPGLFRILPDHDKATLTVAFMSIIRGARLAAEIILEESAAQPSIVYMGSDVMILEDRVVHLLRGSGTEPVV